MIKVFSSVFPKKKIKATVQFQRYKDPMDDIAIVIGWCSGIDFDPTNKIN